MTHFFLHPGHLAADAIAAGCDDHEWRRVDVPKGSDVRSMTDYPAQHIMDRLNNRPRKSLGFLTPNEVFYERKKLTGCDSVALGS